MAGKALGLADVSRETSGRLRELQALVLKWTAHINLISQNSAQDIWNRHISDSAQLYGFLPDGASHWADLGSGAGFPGLVIAILAAQHHPDLRVTMVESDVRKAAFLSAALNALSLEARVEPMRIEVLAPLQADVVSARALASLPKLLNYADRHLSRAGTAVFPKGANTEEEIATALETWSFRVQKHPSATDPSGVILTIGDIARV